MVEHPRVDGKGGREKVPWPREDGAASLKQLEEVMPLFLGLRVFPVDWNGGWG